MFEVEKRGETVTVRRGEHRVAFEIHARYFTFVGPEGGAVEDDDRVPIGDELRLMNRLLDALNGPPMATSPRGRLLIVEASDGVALVRLCAALVPILEAARGRRRPEVLEIQQHALARLGTVPSLLLEADLYEDRFLTADLCRYPAMFGVLERLDRLAAAEAVRILRSWRSLLSPSGRSYRSLNLTLDAVTDESPVRLLWNLRHIHLRAPVLEPLRLCGLLHAVELARRRRSRDHDAFLEVWLRSSAVEIRRALQRMAEFHGAFVDPDWRDDLAMLVGFVHATPPSPGMHIVGLVERTIERQRDHERQEALEAVGGPEVETARPAVALPESADLRFLATVRDVFDEADSMHHCLHTFAQQAVHGDSYLFHVTHGDDHATACVAAGGELLGVKGPFNHHNSAVDHGRRLLEPWCELLRESTGGRASAAGEVGLGSRGGCDERAGLGQLGLFDAVDRYEDEDELAAALWMLREGRPRRHPGDLLGGE